MIRQEWCDPKRPDAVEVALVEMDNGNIEWIPRRNVRHTDIVKMVVVTSRPPLMHKERA